MMKINRKWEYFPGHVQNIFYSATEDTVKNRLETSFQNRSKVQTLLVWNECTWFTVLKVCPDDLSAGFWLMWSVHRKFVQRASSGGLRPVLVCSSEVHKKFGVFKQFETGNENREKKCVENDVTLSKILASTKDQQPLVVIFFETNNLCSKKLEITTFCLKLSSKLWG